MKKRTALSAVLALLFTLPAWALRLETGENVTISQPVFEDIYVFSGAIQIDAPVHGDIWCAGGTIYINDTINGDLVVAGGNVFVRGNVLDDIRCAGGSLTISGQIGGDLLVAGGSVTVASGVVIEGSVAVSGGFVTFDGTARGALQSAAGTLVLNGTVGKDLEFNGDQLQLNGTVGGNSVLAARQITLGPRVTLNGPVRYWSEAGEISFGNALQNGTTASFDPALRQQFERPDFKFLGFASLMAVLWYLIASFTMLWLGQWLFGKYFASAATTARQDPMRSMGYGFLYFAAVPVAIVLLFVTVIGIPIGLIALMFYILLIALANIITVLTGAHWIRQRKDYAWNTIRMALVALGLLVVLKILGSVPFLGWFIKAATVFTAFGAIIYSIRQARASQAV
jgi:cytoskeletal protein CcmA (bactofilin family)